MMPLEELYRCRCMCAALHTVCFIVPEPSWGRGRCWRLWKKGSGLGMCWCCDSLHQPITCFPGHRGPAQTHARAHARLSHQPFGGGTGEASTWAEKEPARVLVGGWMAHLRGVELVMRAWVPAARAEGRRHTERTRKRNKTVIAMQCPPCSTVLCVHIRGNEMQEKAHLVILVFQHPLFFL